MNIIIKIISPLLFTVLIFGSLSGQIQADTNQAVINYFEGSSSKQAYQEIRDTAFVENRHVMISIISEWCYWCRAMEETTFKDDEVVNKLNQNFLVLRVDGHTEIGLALSAKFRVSSFPTLLFFTPDGYFIDKRTGYIRDAKAFVGELRDLLKVESSGLPERGFDPSILNPSFPAFYLSSFQPDLGEKELELTAIAVDTLMGLNPEQWLDEIPWSLIYRFQIGMGPIGSFFLDNYERYNERFGSSESYSHLINLLNQNIAFFAHKGAEREALELIETAKGLEAEKSDEISLRFKVAFYMQSSDWSAVLDELEDHLNQSTNPNLNSINSVVLKIHDSTSESEILKRAAALMKRVTQKERLYQHFDTYASLLFRLGKKEEGTTAAQKAIELGEASGIDVSDTRFLLEIYRD